MTDSAKHSQILATYTQIVGECPILIAQPVPLATHETTQILQQALSSARAERNWADAAQISQALVLIRFDRFDLFAARQYAEETLGLLRTANSPQIHIARALSNLATIHYYTGDTHTGIGYINEAIQVVLGAGLALWQGYFWCSLASMQCYNGQYSAGDQSFEQARLLFIQEESDLGIAWWHYRQACEQERDHGSAERVVERLQVALPVLSEKISPKVTIEILLALAEGYLGQGDAPNTEEVIDKAEQLLNAGQYYWYRPTLLMLKAHLALSTGDYKLAAQHVFKGLGMVGDQGDLRTLSPMYRLLVAILQHDRSDPDTVLNALERAIASGRVRARRRDLALALKEAGIYIKSSANRPTARARGAGFLYEAEQMLVEMGLPT